jgi:hypothetical protein
MRFIAVNVLFVVASILVIGWLVFHAGFLDGRTSDISSSTTIAPGP